jgi:hypothetical protein
MAAEACYFFIFLFKFQSNYLLKFYIFLVKNRKYHWCGSQDPGVPFLFSAFLFCLSVLVTKRPWSSVSDLSLILSPRPSLMLLSASALFFFDQFFLCQRNCSTGPRLGHGGRGVVGGRQGLDLRCFWLDWASFRANFNLARICEKKCTCWSADISWPPWISSSNWNFEKVIILILLNVFNF